MAVQRVLHYTDLPGKLIQTDVDFHSCTVPIAITFHVVWILGFLCAEKVAPPSRRSPLFTFLAPFPVIRHHLQTNVNTSTWQFQLRLVALNVFLTLYSAWFFFYTESCLNCCCLNQNSLDLKMSSRNFSIDICYFFFILENFIHVYKNAWSYLPVSPLFNSPQLVPQYNPLITSLPPFNYLVSPVSTFHVCLGVGPSSEAQETVIGHTFRKGWILSPAACCQPLQLPSREWGLGHTSPICAGILTRFVSPRTLQVTIASMSLWV